MNSELLQNYNLSNRIRPETPFDLSSASINFEYLDQNGSFLDHELQMIADEKSN